jgi:hypothetical protein
MNTTQNRSTEMSYFIHEDMARAHIDARLEEARRMRRGYQLARARRLSVKAERAAAQARLALARAL